MEEGKVEYFKASEIGKGLPFALTTYAQFKNTEDIYLPSLRDFHAIFWIRKGHGKYVVDFKEYEFQPNTLVLVSKDQLHYFKKFNEDEVEFLSIVFSPEFIYRNDSDLQHLFQFQTGTHTSGQQVLKVSKLIGKKLDVMCSELYTIYNSWDAVYQSKAFYHWLCLLLIQCEMMQEAQNIDKKIQYGKNASSLLAFNDLLEKNYKTEFKAEFYANNLNLPIKSLAQLTKEHFKISTKAVIDKRRILEIKRQLKGTSKSGKTIAYELNFGEPTNMFKYFKKHVGITPNEFKDLP